jgi:chloride channel 3/4/5
MLAVKVLLQRGFPHMLSAPVLAIFCAVYFIIAAITAGISVPAGLVVPMLLIGGSYGRLIGLGALEMKKQMCEEYSTLDTSQAFSDTFYFSTYTRWMVRTCRMPDPGTFAIIGAASFLGGSGRITVMLATVLLELTDDATMIAPVGIVCVLAMLVGNSFNHGLYHGLIPVFNIPFLNTDPPPEARLASAADVMASSVVVVPKLCHISQVEALLQKCVLSDSNRSHEDAVSHHAFPVVASRKSNSLVGLVTRAQLEYALVAAKEHGEHTLHFIHILKYADRSPLTVFPNTRLSRAYRVFQKLGMRHLPVCNNLGEVVGMLTRKNLMHYLLTDNKETEIMKIKRVQRGARNYLKYRREKSDKLFDMFCNEKDHYINDEEMEKAISHHLETSLGLKYNNDDDHQFAHVMEWVHTHKKNLKYSEVSRKEFDNILAEARE